MARAMVGDRKDGARPCHVRWVVIAQVMTGHGARHGCPSPFARSGRAPSPEPLGIARTPRAKRVSQQVFDPDLLRALSRLCGPSRSLRANAPYTAPAYRTPRLSSMASM